MKNKTFVVISLFLCSTSAFADWNGSTTKEPATTQIDNKDYYQISSAEELAWFSQQVALGSTDINGILTADFSVSSKSVWSPIGGSEKFEFNGKFDGNGHTISDLYFPEEYVNNIVGLFGVIGSKGSVKNLNVKGINFTSKGDLQYAGGIAGYNKGVIVDCSTEGTVTGVTYEKSKAKEFHSYVGGITGYNAGSISNVSNLVTATTKVDTPTDAYAGGIAGFNAGSIFYAKSGVELISAKSPSGTAFAGGLIGFNKGLIKSSFSYNLKEIYGMVYGGAIGVLNQGIAIGCMFDATNAPKWLEVIGGTHEGTELGNGSRSTANMQTAEFVWIMNTIHNTEANADVWRYKASSYPVFSQDDKSSSVFAVTFNIQGAMVTTFTKPDGTVDIPNVPAPEDQKLDAWYGEKIGKVDDKTKITKDDTLTAKYIESNASSSSIVPETSSSSAASSSSVASSSSDKAASSSSATSSSSNKEASSSSKKDDKSSSSSKTDDKSSSSSKKEALPSNIAQQQMRISVGERMLQITGAPANAIYMIADMQGRRLQSGRVSLSNFTISIPQAGTYVIRIGKQTRTFHIR